MEKKNVRDMNHHRFSSIDRDLRLGLSLGGSGVWGGLRASPASS